MRVRRKPDLFAVGSSDEPAEAGRNVPLAGAVAFVIVGLVAVTNLI